MPGEFPPQAAFNKVDNLISGTESFGSGIANQVGQSIGGLAGTGINAIRGLNLPKDGMPGQRTLTTATAMAKPGEKDWRVKLSVPESFKDSRLMLPVMKTGGFTFQYTPSIIISHTANYTANNPVHTNYAFNSYNYSNVDSIQCNGDFYVQNSVEAEYWVSAVHYLRSVTKMRYGEGSSDAGSPPPVVLLNGYGDFVFKNLPVVVTSFQIDLNQEVDYIQTGLFKEALGDFDEGTMKALSWAPTQSQFTINLQPQLSRAAVAQFNMNNFVNGKYVTGGGGFI